MSEVWGVVTADMEQARYAVFGAAVGLEARVKPISPDNYEHLPDAVAAFVHTLIAGTPRVIVLMTNQERSRRNRDALRFPVSRCA